MTATIKEFYQIKQELEQMTPPGFKVEFCHQYDTATKTFLSGDTHITAVSVGKIREGQSTLWLFHFRDLEELEAWKELKSFNPTPLAIAADDAWEGLVIRPFTGIVESCPEGYYIPAPGYALEPLPESWVTDSPDDLRECAKPRRAVVVYQKSLEG